eukprot:2291507-Pyramimonas_sp.AAC.1
MFEPHGYKCGIRETVAAEWGGSICYGRGDKSHGHRLLWSHGRLLSSYLQRPKDTTGIDLLLQDWQPLAEYCDTLC